MDSGNSRHSDLIRCVDSEDGDIIAAINSIPTVDPPAVAIGIGLLEENEIPKSKCGRNGRCTIMGGGRKSRRISRR
jgi:hypothetical protein